MIDDLRPAFVSLPVAGRLLAFCPPAAFARYCAQHPDEFPLSTSRRVALADIEHHPRRMGRRLTLEEIAAADRAEDGNRARYRHYNEQRKAATNA